jgi:hypothetical protein
MSTCPPTVVLLGGVSLPVAVWQHALALEGKGVRLEVDPAGRLLATPQGLLTPDDLARLRDQTEEYKRLVNYVVHQRWLA